MPVYDDQPTDDSTYNSLGVNSGDSEAEADGSEKSLDASSMDASERSANSTTSKDQVEKDEAEKLGKGYTSTEPSTQGKKGLWGRFDKRRSIAALVAFGLVGYGGFWGYTILQGPMQVVAGAQVLMKLDFTPDQDMSNTRTGRLIQYARSANAKERRNLSATGNKFADHYEKKLKASGITPDYGGSRRIKAYEIDTTTAKGQQAKDKLRSQGFDVDSLTPDADGKIRVDIDTGGIGSARRRRLAIAGMVDTIGLNNISAAVASRTLKIRGGVDFHPFKNIAKATDEDIKDYLKKRKLERENRIRNGVAADIPTTTSAGNGTDEDGNSTAPTDADQTAATESGEVLADANGEGSTKVRASKIKTRVKQGFGITGVLATVCGVQQIGNEVTNLRYTNIVLPLIRQSMNIITMGAQIMAGQGVKLDEVREVTSEFYDEKTDTTIFDAKSIQAGLGQEQTGPDIPDASKPGDTQKPPFFQAVDEMVTHFPGGNAFCGAVTSTIGSWMLTGFGVVVSATGPAALALNLGSEAIANKLTGTFLDDIVSWLAGDQVDLALKGAYKGGQLRYGSVLAANDIGIAKGGTRMTAKQARARNNELLAVQKLKTEHESTYNRYFNMASINSLAGKFMLTYAYSSGLGSSSYGSIASLPTKAFATLSSTFSSLLRSPVLAAENDTYDFGFDRFGFTQDEIDNDDYSDPYYNEEQVQGSLQRLNDEYGNPCFNTTIDPVTYAITTKPEVKRYDQIDDKCNDRNNTELTRYRFYLFDSYTAASVACYEGIEVEGRDFCAEVGLTGTGSDVDGAYTFRAATINVLGAQHTARGGKLSSWPSGRKRMDKMYDVIKENSIGVIGFQEMEEEQRDEFRKVAGTEWDLFPTPDKTSHYSSSNSIAWKRSEFTLVDSGYRTNLEYFSGNRLDAPWVKLRHIASGEVIYYANTHDPVGKSETKRRVFNANRHKKEAVDRIAEMGAGAKVIMVGDFNSNYVIREDYDRGINRDGLTYCILTDGEQMRDAYDVANGKAGKCPTKTRIAIDHIFVSNGTNVSKWYKIDDAVMRSKQISDHDVIYADIKIGSTISGGATGQLAWPVSKEDWPKGSQPIAECGLRYSNGDVHTGLDISVPTGTTIYAAAPGKITMTSGSWGAVNIETNMKDELGRTLYVNYQHLSQTKVSKGDTVAVGDVIGISGSTGTLAAHLHFGLWATNEFLGGHPSANSTAGKAMIAKIKNPIDYLPIDRNVKECNK